MNEKTELEKIIPIKSKATGIVTQGEDKMSKNSNASKYKAEKQREQKKKIPKLDGNKVDVKNDSSNDSKVDKKSQNKKKNSPESFDEFVRSFFMKSGGRKSLSEAVAKKINLLISGFDAKPDLVNYCIKNDSSLDKTKQLLIITRNYKQFPKLIKSVKSLVREIIFKSGVEKSEVEPFFPVLDEIITGNLDSLWSRICSLNDSSNGNQENNTPNLKKARVNAFVCAVVWAENMPLKEIVKKLKGTIFSLTKKEVVSFDKILLEYFSTNIEGKNSLSIATLIDWFYAQNDDVLSQLNKQVDIKKSLENELNNEKNIALEKNKEIQRLGAEVDQLKQQIVADHEERRVANIHSKDDQRKQIGRTLRVLEEELPMLQSALTAVGREPPKTMVTKDYLGRAIDSLRDELGKLRSS